MTIAEPLAALRTGPAEWGTDADAQRRPRPDRQCRRKPGGAPPDTRRSTPARRRVAHVDDSASEAVLVDELEVGEGIGSPCGVVSAEMTGQTIRRPRRPTRRRVPVLRGSGLRTNGSRSATDGRLHLEGFDDGSLMPSVVQYIALMEIGETLGAMVRSERIQRGWSLDRAASRLGVSRRLLTQIEAGSANPSLSTLLSIANGFGVDLTQLIASADTTVELVLQPDNASADVLWSTEAGSCAKLLVGKGPLEMWSWRLGPGDSRRSGAHAANSLEALVVTAGSIDITVDRSETTTVGAGQSLIFAAHHAHEYRNTGDHPAEFYLAVFDPIGDGTSR